VQVVSPGVTGLLGGGGAAVWRRHNFFENHFALLPALPFPVAPAGWLVSRVASTVFGAAGSTQALWPYGVTMAV
jgi:hypothetical protein